MNLVVTQYYRIQTRKASGALGNKPQYVFLLLGTQLCGFVRNSSKFTFKPNYSIVFMGYEKADQPLKLTTSTPKFLPSLGPENLVPSNTTVVINHVKPS
jgi:hypothetical protein